ncbi:hypothetical protein BH10BAC5_BH10BAC5_24960 [soil metagenome]
MIKSSKESETFLKDNKVKTKLNEIFVSNYLISLNTDIFLDTIITLTRDNISKVDKIKLRLHLLDSIYSTKDSVVENNIYFKPNKNLIYISSNLKLLFGKLENNLLRATLFITNCKKDDIKCFSFQSYSSIEYLFIIKNNEIIHFIQSQWSP